MTRQPCRALALSLAAALLSACGGGGGGSVPTTPATGSTSGNSTAGKGNASMATLTLAFPPGYHQATRKPTLSAAAIARRAAAASRHPVKASAAKSRYPRYVNPCCGNTLYVYVDGTLDVNGATVSASADGTQTFSIPLYATNTNQIVAVEYDSYGDLLAIGEDDYGTFGAGSALTPTLTMLMNVADIAIMDTPDNSDSSATPSSYLYDLEYEIFNDSQSESLTNEFWLFATDAVGGFVSPAGYGGITNPVLAPIAFVLGGVKQAGTSGVITTLSGGYDILYDYNDDPVVIDPIVQNPAYAVLTAYSYPGINNLINSNQIDPTLIGGQTNYSYYDNWFDEYVFGEWYPYSTYQDEYLDNTIPPPPSFTYGWYQTEFYVGTECGDCG